ncbi:MAG: hypothetical protein WCR07_14000 [Verrucomicrobiota bacterium]
MNTKLIRVCPLATCAILLVSCASSSSIGTKGHPQAGKPVLQLPYYLPKGLVTIEITPTTQAMVTKSVEVVKNTTTKTQNASKTNLVVTKIAEGRETESYQTTIPASEAKAITTWKVSVTVTNVPDIAAGRRYAAFKDSIWFDSNVGLTAPNGLLQTAQSTSVGQAPQVVEDVASAAAAAARLFRGPSVTEETPSDKTQPKSISITFDPTDTNLFASAKSALAGHQLELVPCPSEADGRSKSGTQTSCKDTEGLVFRSLRRFELRRMDSNSIGKLIATIQVPDRCDGGEYVVAMPRNWSTRTKVALDIRDGVLLGFSMDSTSAAARWSGILPAVVGEASEIPKGLLVYQKEVTSAKTEAIKAQAELINAQAELERLKAEIGKKDGPDAK